MGRRPAAAARSGDQAGPRVPTRGDDLIAQIIGLTRWLDRQLRSAAIRASRARRLSALRWACAKAVARADRKPEARMLGRDDSAAAHHFQKVAEGREAHEGIA